MNDLEPWKIWAVTGALVCAILGGAAMRISPIEIGESAAQASILTPDELRTNAAPEPTQSSDQYEAYFSGYSHAPYSGGRYVRAQAPTSISVGDLMAASAASSGEFEAYDLDVAQQIQGPDNSQSGQYAATEVTTHDFSNLGWIDAVDDNAQAGSDMFTEVPQDHLVYTAISDSNTMTFNVDSPDGSSKMFIKLSGTGDVQIANLALQNGEIRVALSNAAGGSNVTANVVQYLSGAVSSAAGQSPAFSGELDETTSNSSIAPEDLDELRQQAAEAEVLAREEALVQAQSEIQQRAAAAQNQYTRMFNYSVARVEQE